MQMDEPTRETCRRVGEVAVLLYLTTVAALVAAPATAQTDAQPESLEADAPTASPEAPSLEPAPSEPFEVEVFKGVQILRGPNEYAYPSSEAVNGREGWVQLNMMIDPQGKPYEVMVMDSSGSPAFEKAALKAVNEVKFAPARRGDTPIDSSFMFKFKFAMGSLAKGATPQFISNYRRLSKVIQSGDKPAADTLLGKLEAQNLYEEAFEHYARYFYFLRWGTPADQLKELKLAIAGEKRPEYLPRKAFVEALIALFVRQVNAQDFGGALDTWDSLEPLAPKDRSKALTDLVNEMKALQQSDQPIQHEAIIGEHSNWTAWLLRNRFSIDVRKGTVSEIKLRCEKQYLFFKYQPGVEYTIGRQKDQCNIEVVGDPGTTFVLRE